MGEGDDPDSNLNLIVQALEEAGYTARIFRMSALDWGLPQRRIRIYIAGFSRALQPESSLVRVEKMLNTMQLKCQLPESCMLMVDVLQLIVLCFCLV